MIINQKIRKLCLKESKGYVLMRSKARCDEHGEVFTPTELVLNMMEELPRDMWTDGKSFLDPTCGNGQFLAAACIVKQQRGNTQVLETIYGADLMPDNVADTKQRLLSIMGDTPANRAIVDTNIVCRDGLKYDYKFTNSNI